jgi:hypothetical protein
MRISINHSQTALHCAAASPAFGNFYFFRNNMTTNPAQTILPSEKQPKTSKKILPGSEFSSPPSRILCPKCENIIELDEYNQAFFNRYAYWPAWCDKCRHEWQIDMEGEDE